MKTRRTNDDDDKLQCPKCGYRFTGSHQCPRCGYQGYYPMSNRQIRRVKWILYPILLVGAILIFLASRGYFG